MAFGTPVMPLAVAIWRHGNAIVNPPDVVTTGNLSPGRRTPITGAAGIGPTDPAQYMELLLPALTDVRGSTSAGGLDICEVPQASGRFYIVQFVDDVGKGFGNEYRLALIVQQPPWPDPIP